MPVTVNRLKEIFKFFENDQKNGFIDAESTIDYVLYLKRSKNLVKNVKILKFRATKRLMTFSLKAMKLTMGT